MIQANNQPWNFDMSRAEIHPGKIQAHPGTVLQLQHITKRKIYLGSKFPSSVSTAPRTSHITSNLHMSILI